MRRWTLLACLLSLSAAGAEPDVTWRIFPRIWQDEASFGAFSEFLVTNRLTGKLALFTSEIHSPMRLDDLLDLMPLLKGRIAALHALGYRVGINHLDTLGHFDERLDVAADVRGAHRFTNIRGECGKAQYCPNDPVWRKDYLGPCYRALAATGADFIWTDDDIRLRNHAVRGGGCFCDACMGRVRARLGYAGPREGLEAWLSDKKDGLARRRAFLQYNRETIADLFAFIGREIHSVSPNMDIGVMDSATATWHGLPHKEVFAALKTPTSDVYWRPGGGFYADKTPDYLLYKANGLAAEAAVLPEGVRFIEGELENFIYQRFDKSEHFTSLEALLYVSLGLSGVAYNVFGDPDNEPISSYASLTRRLEANRDAYRWIFDAAGREPCRGIWSGDGERDAYAGQEGEWLAGDATAGCFANSELQMIGLPIAYRFEDASVFAPSPEVIRALPSGSLEKMLSGGVYLDAASAEALAARGYGADIGFSVAGPAEGDVSERFSDHALNEGLPARSRNSRHQFFHAGKPVKFVPAAGAEVLANYVGEDGKVLRGVCSMGVFENTRSGRVCVNGYMPWQKVSFRAKSIQMKRVFSWLARGALPGWVKSHHRMALWVRGTRIAVLLNMSQDPARNVEIAFQGPVARATMVCPPVLHETPVSLRNEDGYRVARIAELAPWSIAILKFGDSPDERITRKCNGL